MIQNQDFVVVNLTYSIMISLKIHIYAEVIYPRFMKRALLNKKAIDYLSIIICIMWTIGRQVFVQGVKYFGYSCLGISLGGYKTNI